jgi:hypothetical protein
VDGWVGRKPMLVDAPQVQTAKKMDPDKTKLEAPDELGVMGIVVPDICRGLKISRATLCRWLARK